MKRDKEIIGLYIICCFFQVVYFKYVVGSARPFVYIQGVYLQESNVLPYLEICVLCLLIIMLVLLFSDSYSFYMENYGRLLLVRNCNLTKCIFNICRHLAMKLFIMVGIQLIINVLFNLSYFINNIATILKGEIAYYLILLFTAILEFCICSWVKENLVQIFLYVYVFSSCVVCYYLKSKVVQILFMPGKILELKKFFETEKWISYLLNEITIPMLSMIILFLITVMHCKRKDIF